MTLPRVLRAGDYRDLLIAESVSALGDWMGTVAFIALTFAITHSATAVGGMLTLRLAPAALAGPIAARIVARWNPRRTMLAMNAIRAGIVTAIPFVQAVWWVFFWAFFLELCSLIFLPARDGSIIHLLNDEDDLSLANGLILGSSYGTLPLGAALFTLISAASGGVSFLPGGRFAVAFWLDAATFVLGYVLIARITSLRSVHPALEGAGGDNEAIGKMPFLSALRLRLVRGALPPVLGVAIGLGSLFSLGIDFVRHDLNASDAEFGALIILFGVGAAAGMALLQIRRPRQPLKVLRPGVIVIGIVLAAMSLAPNLWAAFAGAVAFGGAASYAMVGGMTGIQRALEDDTERQLAFAAFHVGLRIALVLGALGAGAAGDLLKHTSFPGVGRLAPTRAVLFSCGLVIVLAAWVFGGNIQAAIDDAEAGSTGAVGTEPGPQAAQPSSMRASSTRWSRIPLRIARSTRGPTRG